MIDSGEIAGDACVIARGQTAGRGTNGRNWVSPRDAGIYMSVVLFDVAADGRSMPWITTACGVACAEVLRREFDIDVRVKPINDLMLNGGKLGGILTEASIESRAIRSLIVGIGVNLRTTELGNVAAPNGPAFLDAAISSMTGVLRDSLANDIARNVAAFVRSLRASNEAVQTQKWQPLIVES